MKIVIPGGSGQVGSLLAAHFHGAGHAVTVLSRRPAQTPWRTVAWQDREIDGADLVVNLAGCTVNCRYTEPHRREIMDSRIQSTEAIGRTIANAAQPPSIWMNASTATIYRNALDRPMDEATGEIGGHEPDVPAAWNFSIQVATRWEQALFAASLPRTRRIALRSALILGPGKGGIFETLLGLVRAGLGGAAGSGRQFISWIHYEDFVRAIDFLVAHPALDGAINISAPQPLPNREFMRELRRAWGAPLGLPAAEWMLHLGAALMRTETELVLKSRRVIPGRLTAAGFEFHFPEWPAAARDLVQRVRATA